MRTADERAELAVRLHEANSVDDALAGRIDTALFPEEDRKFKASLASSWKLA